MEQDGADIATARQFVGGLAEFTAEGLSHGVALVRVVQHEGCQAVLDRHVEGFEIHQVSPVMRWVRQATEIPPLTLMAWPVMRAAAGLER
ncbi:hypothetical protein ACFFX0_20775 [Citricoccus parietis]|uniref:Uncharacterized protein n=1 Tax=Citricoccus parietis TaxID=592307 RepID=A0ABV5G3I2_9MICC